MDPKCYELIQKIGEVSVSHQDLEKRMDRELLEIDKKISGIFHRLSELDQKGHDRELRLGLKISQEVNQLHTCLDGFKKEVRAGFEDIKSSFTIDIRSAGRWLFGIAIVALVTYIVTYYSGRYMDMRTKSRQIINLIMEEESNGKQETAQT